MFTDGLIKDPSSIRDIKAMLDDIEVLTETYNNATGEKLSLMFELFPSHVTGYTSVQSSLRDQVDRENFDGHYYEKIGDMHQYNTNVDKQSKPGNPYLITDPTSGCKARLYARQIVSNLGMLKNFMSVFIYVGNKFSAGKSPNDLSNQLFMTPVQIYNNIVEYITASAFAQGFGSDSDKITKKDSSGKFIVPETWDKPNNSSQFGIGFNVNFGNIVGKHKFGTKLYIDDVYQKYITALKDYLDSIKYIDNSLAPLKNIQDSINLLNDAVGEIDEKVDGMSDRINNMDKHANNEFLMAELMGSIMGAQLTFMNNMSIDVNRLKNDVNKRVGELSKEQQAVIENMIILLDKIVYEKTSHAAETASVNIDSTHADIARSSTLNPDSVPFTPKKGKYDGGVDPSNLSDAIIKLVNHIKNIANIDYSEGIEIYRPNIDPHYVRSSHDEFSIAGASGNNWFPQEKSTHFNFKRLFGVWMRSTLDDLCGHELLSFSREDEHFVMMMKALASKIFTVTGMYDVLDRPHEINSISPIRMIIGGDEGIPKVESGATELYLRLPLLAQFYRDLFKFDGDEKTYYSDLTGIPRRDNLLLKISMVPEVEGVFSGLIKFIFRRTKDVYETAYTDEEMKQLIAEINIIYQRMQPKHGQKVVMETIREFVDEMNRRYAIVTKADHDKYVSEIDTYEYNYGDPNVAATGFDQYGRPIDVDVAILPGEGDMQIVRQSPAERLLSTSIKRRDPLAGHKLDDGYYKLLYRFRCCIDKLFEDADAGAEYTFKNAIKSAQVRLRNAQNDLEKYKIIASLVRGVDIYSKVEGLKYLLFHETIVVGLNTISGLHTLLQSFRDQAMLIDLHKYQELFFKHADESNNVSLQSFRNEVVKYFQGEKMEVGIDIIERLVDNVFGKSMNSIFNGGSNPDASIEYEYKKMNGWTANLDRLNGSIRVTPAQQSSMRIKKGEKLCETATAGFINILSGSTIEQYMHAISSDKHNLEARDRILAFFRACFDREYVMKMLVQLVFGLCGDSQSLAEFRIEDGQLFIDSAGIKKVVEELFTDVSYFIDSLRPFIPQDVMDKYTAKINPGSYYWLQEQVMEKLIKGRPPQSGIKDPKIAKKGYVSIDEACRKLSKTYDILTLKYNYDMSVFNAPVELKLTAKKTSQTHYDKVFAEIIFYNAAIPNSGLAVSTDAKLVNVGHAISPPDIVDFKGQTVPWEALHVNGYAANRTIDTRFIARFKQLYTFDESFTMNRSILFMFNQLIAKYIRQVYDVATQKIYINTINNFANNVFNQSVTDFMYTYPDISPMVFSKYEDATTEKIDSRKLMQLYSTNPSVDKEFRDALIEAIRDIPQNILDQENLLDRGNTLYNDLSIITQHLLVSIILNIYVKLITSFPGDDVEMNEYVNVLNLEGNAEDVRKELLLRIGTNPAAFIDAYNRGLSNETRQDIYNVIRGSIRVFKTLTNPQYIYIPNIAFQTSIEAADNKNIRDVWAASIFRGMEFAGNSAERQSPSDVRKYITDLLYSVPTIYKKAGEPLVDVTVKYDDAITADVSGKNYFGSKTSGQLKEPETISELNKLLVKNIPYVKKPLFGERMDPDSLHVLFTSLSVILKNIITSKNPLNQQLVHLTESISDVPIYMKEKYRSQLPLFRLYFKNLVGLCDTVRKFISAREVNLNRMDWAMTQASAAANANIVPNINPWPYVLVNPATDCEATRARFSGILDSVVKGCNSLIACCDQVVRETGDEPKYLEVASGSIRDYKNQYGNEPFMPISSVLYVLRNTTAENASDFLPVQAFGSDQFKWQYGTRVLLSQPHVAFNADHTPGHKQIIDSYNSLLETRNYIDVKRADSYLKNVVKSLRFIFELKHIKGLLTSHVKDSVDLSINSVKYNSTSSGIPKRNLLTEGNFVRGDMILGQYEYNSNDERKSGNANNYNSIQYAITNNPSIPLSIVDTVYVLPRLTATEKDKQLQKRLVPVYSLTHPLQQIINLTESGMREDRVKDLIKYITGVCDDKKSLVIQNIIDLNIIPINVHALMREIPLANLYNYAYTFDRLVIELYYGLQNDNARKLISELCRDVYDKDGTLSALSHAHTAKDMLVALLIRPYMNVVGGDDHYYELTKDMLSGVSGNELGRPKFLSDQLYGKAIFGELYENYNTYSEMGPGAGRVVNNVITLIFIKASLIRLIDRLFGTSFTKESILNAVNSLFNDRVRKPSDLSNILVLDEQPEDIDNLVYEFIYDAYNVLRSVLNVGSLYSEVLSDTIKSKLGAMNVRYGRRFIRKLDNVNILEVDMSRNRKHFDPLSTAGNKSGTDNVLHYLDVLDKQDVDNYGATMQPDNENVNDNDQVHEVQIDGELKSYLVAVGKMRFNTKFIRNLIFIVNLYRSVRLKLQRDLTYNKEVIARSSAITDPSITEFRGNSVYRPRRLYGIGAGKVRYGEHNYERYKY
jgi:hypothetical protein